MKTNALIEKMKADVEAKVHDELAANPHLVTRIESIVEAVGEVAADDVIGSIHNPILRVVVKQALHRAIESAFDLLPKDGAS